MVNEFKKLGLRIKGFNKNVKYVHRKTKRLRLFIFFDMLWCKIRYLITSTEYRVYEFYFMKNKERKHYLSKATHNFYQRFLCPKKLLHMLNNKENLSLNIKLINWGAFSVHIIMGLALYIKYII